MTTRYEVDTLEDLDNFDAHDAYWNICSDNFTVYVRETDEMFYPVFGYRENGDMDGFEGWS